MLTVLILHSVGVKQTFCAVCVCLPGWTLRWVLFIGLATAQL